MRSIIIISLLALGCTNDVPPDNAPEKALSLIHI